MALFLAVLLYSLRNHYFKEAYCFKILERTWIETLEFSGRRKTLRIELNTTDSHSFIVRWIGVEDVAKLMVPLVETVSNTLLLTIIVLHLF